MTVRDVLHAIGGARSLDVDGHRSVRVSSLELHVLHVHGHLRYIEMAGLKVIHDALADGFLVLGAVIAAGQAEGQKDGVGSRGLIVGLRKGRRQFDGFAVSMPDLSRVRRS